MKIFKNWKKWIVPVLTVVILISLAVGFIPPVADWVADVFNKPVEVVTSVFRQIAMVGIGLFFVYAGALLAGSLILGGGLIVIGVALVAVAIWPWFRRPKGE